MIKKIISIILFIFWLSVIFYLSNQNGTTSSNLSSSLTSYLSLLNININTLVIRKFAHYTEYLILGTLTTNLINNYKKITKKEIIQGIVFCILYSISDEFHQLFINGRTPKILDVIIDTLGSLTGIYIYNKFLKKRS